MQKRPPITMSEMKINPTTETVHDKPTASTEIGEGLTAEQVLDEINDLVKSLSERLGISREGAN